MIQERILIIKVLYHNVDILCAGKHYISKIMV